MSKNWLERQEDGNRMLLMWEKMYREFAFRFRHLYNWSLGWSEFPQGKSGGWSSSQEKRPLNYKRQFSDYRPLFMIDEAGKLFERIIAARLVTGSGNARAQWGTVQGDARLTPSLSMEASRRNRVTLTVSLDIVNAFKILFWKRIRTLVFY